MRTQVALSPAHRSFVALLLASAALAACAGKSKPVEAPVDEKANTSIINATTIIGKCPDKAQMNAKEAQRTIQKLAESCQSVPGGRAHFSALLRPGGRIELASPEGNPADGVVPTCVLKHQLLHQVRLKSPCTLDVTLEEQKMPASSGPREGAPSGG